MTEKTTTFFTALMGLSSIHFLEAVSMYEVANNILHLLINGAQFAIGAITLYKLVKPSKKK